MSPSLLLLCDCLQISFSRSENICFSLKASVQVLFPHFALNKSEKIVNIALAGWLASRIFHCRKGKQINTSSLRENSQKASWSCLLAFQRNRDKWCLINFRSIEQFQQDFLIFQENPFTFRWECFHVPRRSSGEHSININGFCVAWWSELIRYH